MIVITNGNLGEITQALILPLGHTEAKPVGYLAWDEAEVEDAKARFARATGTPYEEVVAYIFPQGVRR